MKSIIAILIGALPGCIADATILPRQTPTLTIPTHTTQCSSAYWALYSAGPTPGPALSSVISWIQDPVARSCSPREAKFLERPDLVWSYTAWQSSLAEWVRTGQPAAMSSALTGLCAGWLEGRRRSYRGMEASLSSVCRCSTAASSCAVVASSTTSDVGVVTTTTSLGDAGNAAQTPGSAAETPAAGSAARAERTPGWAAAAVGLAIMAIIGF